MKLSKSTKISIRIIVTFTTAMFATFVPELFREFFGDWYCKLGTACDYAGEFGHHSFNQYHWGWRHWLWVFMGLCLFVVQIGNTVTEINKTEQ